jgi:hypothetical protein
MDGFQGPVEEPEISKMGRGDDEKKGRRKYGQQVVNRVELSRLTRPQHDAAFTSLTISCALALAFAFAALIAS